MFLEQGWILFFDRDISIYNLKKMYINYMEEYFTHHISYYLSLYLFLLKTGKVSVCFLPLCHRSPAESKNVIRMA
jgi:hypothetical protein